MYFKARDIPTFNNSMKTLCASILRANSGQLNTWTSDGNLPYVASADANRWTLKTSKEVIRKIEQAMKDHAANRAAYTFYKWFRPWHNVANFEEKLKLRPNTMWVGLEIESGARDGQARRRAVEFLLSQDYVTADREGYGNNALEATFPPRNHTALFTKGDPVRKYYEQVFNLDNFLQHLSNSMVGTHVNISTRNTREVVANNTVAVPCVTFRNVANVLLDGINRRYFRQVLDRVPYILEPQITRINYPWEPYYVEYKWFNTTYDYETLKEYVAYAQQFHRTVEEVALGRMTLAAAITSLNSLGRSIVGKREARRAAAAVAA